MHGGRVPAQRPDTDVLAVRRCGPRRPGQSPWPPSRRRRTCCCGRCGRSAQTARRAAAGSWSVRRSCPASPPSRSPTCSSSVSASSSAPSPRFPTAYLDPDPVLVTTGCGLATGGVLRWTSATRAREGRTPRGGTRWGRAGAFPVEVERSRPRARPGVDERRAAGAVSSPKNSTCAGQRGSRRAVPAAIAAVDPTVVSARARDGGDDGIAAAEAEAAASKVRRDGVGVDDTGTREGRAGAGDPGGGGGGRRGRRRARIRPREARRTNMSAVVRCAPMGPARARRVPGAARVGGAGRFPVGAEIPPRGTRRSIETLLWPP